MRGGNQIPPAWGGAGRGSLPSREWLRKERWRPDPPGAMGEVGTDSSSLLGHGDQRAMGVPDGPGGTGSTREDLLKGDWLA